MLTRNVRSRPCCSVKNSKFAHDETSGRKLIQLERTNQKVTAENRGVARFAHLRSRRALCVMLLMAIAVVWMVAADNTEAIANETTTTAQASAVGNSKFQLRFKNKFLPIRRDLKSCSKAKIRSANKRLNRIQRQIPKLKINIQWNKGVSRWIARYAQAVAAHGMGKKAKAKRMARKSLRLYQIARKDGLKPGRDLWGPGSASSPNVSSMSYGVFQLIDGDYVCGRGY